MGTLTVECNTDSVSDGYHTFGELYAHRCYLFAALMCSNKGLAWRAKRHADGSIYEGWFIAGMLLPAGAITYHLPLDMWSMLEGVAIRDLAPEWDGHTAADVLIRLADWCSRVDPNELP